MRDLTQKEIDNAPDWATHYFIEESGGLCYECKDRYINVNMKFLSYQTTGVEDFSKPIPRKEFDIEDYCPSDLHMLNVNSDGNIEFSVGDFPKTINKQDSIAFAKHFKLTQDDLK